MCFLSSYKQKYLGLQIFNTQISAQSDFKYGYQAAILENQLHARHGQIEICLGHVPTTQCKMACRCLVGTCIWGPSTFALSFEIAQVWAILNKTRFTETTFFHGFLVYTL
jgi:hypothetical protein